MARLTRTWPALAVWGSGLLHLSLGASLTLGMARPLSTAVAVGLLLIGAAELVWGALALRAGRPVAPRTAAVGALVAIGVSGGALVSGSSPLAVAAAVLLTLGAVAALAPPDAKRAMAPPSAADASAWPTRQGWGPLYRGAPRLVALRADARLHPGVPSPAGRGSPPWALWLVPSSSRRL